MKKNFGVGDDVIVVNGTSLSQGTIIEKHRHNVKIKHHNGGENDYQIGCVFTCMDEAIKQFEKNRKK